MDNQIQQATPDIIIGEIEQTEEEEIKEILDNEPKIKYRQSPKFNRWLDLFLDKGNKYNLSPAPFGNATQSAIYAYSLNKETQYWVGAQIGHKNIKKVKNLASLYLDKQGVTYGKMTDIIFNKMLKSNSPDMWFMILEMLGHPVPKYTPRTNPFVFMYNQKNNINVEGGDSLAKLTDEQLDYLIESKTREINTAPIDAGEGTPDEVQSIEVQPTTPETD